MAPIIHITGPLTPEYEGPVCTRRREPARIICRDRKQSEYPVVALSGECEETVIQAGTDGRTSPHEEMPEDLMACRIVADAPFFVAMREGRIVSILPDGDRAASASFSDCDIVRFDPTDILRPAIGGQRRTEKSSLACSLRDFIRRHRSRFLVKTDGEPSTKKKITNPIGFIERYAAVVSMKSTVTYFVLPSALRANGFNPEAVGKTLRDAGVLYYNRHARSLSMVRTMPGETKQRRFYAVSEDIFHRDLSQDGNHS